MKTILICQICDKMQANNNNISFVLQKYKFRIFNKTTIKNNGTVQKSSTNLLNFFGSELIN